MNENKKLSPDYLGNKLHYEHRFKPIVFFVNYSLVLCCIVNLWTVTLAVNPCRICNNLSGIILRSSPQEDAESVSIFSLTRWLIFSVKHQQPPFFKAERCPLRSYYYTWHCSTPLNIFSCDATSHAEISNIVHSVVNLACSHLVWNTDTCANWAEGSNATADMTITHCIYSTCYLFGLITMHFWVYA